MTSNKKQMIEKSFNGDENAYRAYMKRLGRNGGKASNTGGFSGKPELARKAAQIRWSKRAKEGIK